MSFKNKFSNLGHPNKIWTVSAIHGELDQLAAIHQAVYGRFQPGDRLIYTGNYFGGGRAAPLRVMDELLYFRRALMAKPGVDADDIVYLRGRQEELWHRLQHLQFTPNASRAVEWALAQHPETGCILKAYGSSAAEIMRVAREGIMSLTRWSSALKSRIRSHPGHEKFFTVLRRAAFTENRHSNDNNLLFVHAGLNPARALTEQGDDFWWSAANFNAIESYAPFRAVVRGHDPEHGGVRIGKAAISLDGGCGHGGKLVCAQLSDIGDVLEILAA